ncbi:aliphatic sulfonate ABC transporter substrate-binding protein [Clostridium cylindrosporum]|uniref:Taurine-binding periplasmic protein TauA n=1 Tax=Clostridium cylindrosporum DSM 605 TaxID=1121307 RepID=A0A0J8G237_CLOCY|nr:aliphatic sulfonate ABC transporter substrate-binding protein [Clostridium cylindrosporum]KMT21816.1 taurine-binding periplasmic protein TauA [Clostridium cylindrosporum DSM 605]
MKRIKKFIGASLLLTLSLSLASCGVKSETTSSKGNNLPEVVNIGTQQMPNDETIARAKGFFESELGVKVNIKEFDSGKDVNTALASKSIDFGLLGTTPATISLASGIPVEVIWIHDVIGEVESLAVRNKSNIKSVAELKGKRIAVPFGSTAHYSLLRGLKLNNLTEKDLTILDMQPADIVAAWQRGDIDGAYVWQPTLQKLLGDGSVLVSSKNLAEKGAVTADIEVVRSEFSKKYPEIVSKYIGIQQKSHEIYESNLDDAVETVSKALQISKDESSKQIKESIWVSAKEQLSDKYFGTSSNKGNLVNILKDTADFLADQKTIPSSPDIKVFENAVNPSYIEKALKK